eukprot:TRINITY_DN4318_c0_g1_i1.p1 TRINITY_DN4318_c0_g1~~TRINITY_DN4318_c0_g1_i1.p1  ORF type:complete len:151 (+),score=13.30 TRINITY_DN4318_c0_g1_i1:98-550(+)
MEFSDVGAYCAYTYCRKQVYLPVKCSNCGLQYCEKHVQPQDHECPKNSAKNSKTNIAENNQTKSLEKCPICKVKLTPINEFICKTCKLKVCLQHRYHEEHSLVNGNNVQTERATETKLNHASRKEKAKCERKELKDKDSDKAKCSCCIIV